MITRDEVKTIAGNGVWKQNTSIVQILGLCPLLATTTNAVNGIMLSLATIIVMAISGFAVASLRNLIPHEIRIPVFILIVAALVTVVDLLFNANLHELYLVLGIFIPLIVTNCIVLAPSRGQRATRRCWLASKPLLPKTHRYKRHLTAFPWASACYGPWHCSVPCVNSLATAPFSVV